MFTLRYYASKIKRLYGRVLKLNAFIGATVLRNAPYPNEKGAGFYNNVCKLARIFMIFGVHLRN